MKFLEAYEEAIMGSACRHGGVWKKIVEVRGVVEGCLLDAYTRVSFLKRVAAGNEGEENMVSVWGEVKYSKNHSHSWSESCNSDVFG